VVGSVFIEVIGNGSRPRFPFPEAWFPGDLLAKEKASRSSCRLHFRPIRIDGCVDLAQVETAAVAQDHDGMVVRHAAAEVALETGPAALVAEIDQPALVVEPDRPAPASALAGESGSLPALVSSAAASAAVISWGSVTPPGSSARPGGCLGTVCSEAGTNEKEDRGGARKERAYPRRMLVR
jgi:hypothetical protein